MAFFGLISKKEHEQALATAQEKALSEIQALKQQVENLPGWVLATAGAEKFNIPDASYYASQAELFRKLSWIAQVIDILGSTVPVVKFSVARIVAGKEPKDIPNHPFEMLLNHPNPIDSRSEFLYGTAAGWKLNGNVYWFLNRKDEYSPPDELWNIPANMIIPLPDAKMYIKGYLYYPGDGRELFLQPHEIIHFHRYNPFSRIIGLSALESLAVQAAGGLGMISWNAKFWGENNGRLPGILLYEQMIADPTWKQIKDDTREAAKKRELLMLRGVGSGGVKWIANAMPQKDMEFIQGLEMTKKEIQDTLCPGLSVWLGGNATYSNAGAARAAYNELTLYPMLVMIQEKITNEILPAYPGRPLIGYFEDIRISDKQMKLQEQVEYSKSHTTAEVREKYYGDPPLGDERDDLLPSQIQATSGAAEQPPTQTPSPVYQSAPQDNMGDMGDEQNAPTDTTETAMQADLSRYERKALKRIGQAVEFNSTVIPAGMLRNIGIKLLTCENETAVKALFNLAREKAKPGNALYTVAEAINNYTETISMATARKGGPGSTRWGDGGGGGGAGGGGDAGGSGGGEPEDKKMMELSKKTTMSETQASALKDMNSAYAAGEKYSSKGYSGLNSAMRNDPSIFDKVDGMSHNEMVAFESGLLGKSGEFEFVTAWRVGDIPQGGRSTNFTDQKLEPGLSVMAASNGKTTKDEFSKMFLLSKNRPVVYVSGIVHPFKTGADGEPLLLQVKKLNP